MDIISEESCQWWGLLFGTGFSCIIWYLLPLPATTSLVQWRWLLPHSLHLPLIYSIPFLHSSQGKVLKLEHDTPHPSWNPSHKLLLPMGWQPSSLAWLIRPLVIWGLPTSLACLSSPYHCLGSHCTGLASVSPSQVPAFTRGSLCQDYPPLPQLTSTWLTPAHLSILRLSVTSSLGPSAPLDHLKLFYLYFQRNLHVFSMISYMQLLIQYILSSLWAQRSYLLCSLLYPHANPSAGLTVDI